MTQLTTCPDAETVATRAAAHVIRVLEQARAERGVAHLALSGGTTPGRTYELLAAEEFSWHDVEIWFADERCVAPDDEESNYLLARRTLLDPAGIAPEQVHRMRGELGPLEGALSYESELEAALGPPEPAPASSPSPPVLDIVVLGIGPDGHICSLFPGAAALDAEDSVTCLGVNNSPKPPPERITLTLGVLHAARGCLLLATGPGKADAVNAMLGEPSPHVPASLLARGRLTAIVDDAAAPDSPPS